MGSGDEVVEIYSLEKGLLSGETREENDETVLYTASFRESEEWFINYQTAKWVLYSLPLILAWGFGLLMLLYLPLRRYLLRKDIRSRRLHLTSNSIVYEVTSPAPFPCFGVLKKEKHILLSSVKDVVIEQGYLQSRCGIHSVRFKIVGMRRLLSDDAEIQGIANPNSFREAVLMRLSSMKSEAIPREISQVEDLSFLRTPSAPSWTSASKFPRSDFFPQSGDLLLLQKLEEVGSSVKRVQTIIEQSYQTSKPID